MLPHRPPDNTYGTPTSLPWAINFGDGIPRHPTQLYEVAFLLLLIPILFRVLQRIVLNRIVILSGARSSQREVLAQSKDSAFADGTSGPARNPVLDTRDSGLGTSPGDAFKLFMVSYVSFRLLCDFIKPYPRLFLGLGGIQWACVLVLLYYFPDITRWLRPTIKAAAPA